MFDFDRTRPPRGVTFQSNSPDGFAATATMRSRQAFVVVPLAILWTGLMIGLGCTRQFHDGTFTVEDCLFGIAFLVGTVLLVTRAVMTTFGKTVLVKNGTEGAVYVGVGSLGYSRRFRWCDIESIEEGRRLAGRGGIVRFIKILFKPGTRKPIKFGTMVTNEGRAFLLNALRWQIARER
jgi:hypothetical protein